MSYSRMFTDDVYVYATPKGVICCQCYFCDELEPSYLAESTQEMIDHLKAHLKIGHSFPATIFDQLLADDAANYPNKIPPKPLTP
jgi:hypothetical protein